jgi:hypothetical protein
MELAVILFLLGTITLALARIVVLLERIAGDPEQWRAVFEGIVRLAEPCGHGNAEAFCRPCKDIVR